MTANGKHPGGRPTEYLEEYNEQAYKLCLLGATDKEMGEFFGVSEVTINAWKTKFPEFLKSLKQGKIKADADVAEKLYQRALGYEHPETKVFCHEGDITEHEVIKHYPPDTAAAFIWLKNRAGWKDKQEHNIGISKELGELLGLIDGSSKGKLPDRDESENAG